MHLSYLQPPSEGVPHSSHQCCPRRGRFKLARGFQPLRRGAGHYPRVPGPGKEVQEL